MKIPFVSRKRMEQNVAVLKEKIKAAKLVAKKYHEKAKLLSVEVKKLKSAHNAFLQIKGEQDMRPLFAQCLRGEGIEIGALHHPLPVPSGVKVRYVDYKSREQNIKNYPELDATKIVETDYICDGERLEVIPDESQDFVIANHMVEHCINPLGTIEQFLRVLRPGGLLFISLPDKRYTFDVLRPITPFYNPADDYKTSRKIEPVETYLEFESLVHDRNGQEAYEKQNNIHFHAWTQREILELFIEANRTFKMPLEIELAARNGIEFIVVLRKEVPEAFDRAGIVSRGRQQAVEAATAR